MTTLSKTKKASSTKRSKKSARSSKTLPSNKVLSAKTQKFVRHFELHLQQENFLPRGTKILVAVSGGPDSLALLSLLAFLAPKYHWQLRIAHVNYHLRGRDSLLDEKLVRAQAKTLGLPLSVLSSRVRPTKNIEAVLREIRYGYFKKMRKQFRLDTVVTAHTMNDLAETVLMNLLRGAGATGLSPFMRTTPSLVRPFLTTTRTEIESFLKAMKIVARHDHTNQEEVFVRNRIRHTLIPLIEKNFNPNIIATLARTAKNLSQNTSRHTHILLVERKGASHALFNRQEFLLLPKEMRLSCLSELLRKATGRSSTESFLREILKAIESTKGKTGTVQRKGLKVSVFHATVELAFDGETGRPGTPKKT